MKERIIRKVSRVIVKGKEYPRIDISGDRLEFCGLKYQDEIMIEFDFDTGVILIKPAQTRPE